MADPDLPGDRRAGVGQDPRGGPGGARPADRAGRARPGAGPGARGASPRVALERPARGARAADRGGLAQGPGAAALRGGVRPAGRAGASSGPRAARGVDRAPGPAPVGCWRRSTRGCRSSSPTGRSPPASRSPPTSRGRTRCSGCSRARSARARPSWRCARCCRWSTRAGRRRCWRPTSVLAAQHVRTLRALLGDLAEGGLLGGSEIGTRVALLTGAQSTAERRSNLLEAASGQAGIVVGTHALLSDPVQFADLGLVVIDEQHKFGVEQRGRLQAKAANAPAPAGDHRDPDPAHGRDDGVRRAGDLGAAARPGRPQRHHHARRAGRQPAVDGPDVEPGARGGRARRSGVRRVRADRRRRGGRRGRRCRPRPRRAGHRRRGAGRRAARPEEAAARRPRGRRDAAGRPAAGRRSRSGSCTGA